MCPRKEDTPPCSAPDTQFQGIVTGIVPHSFIVPSMPYGTERATPNTWQYLNTSVVRESLLRTLGVDSTSGDWRKKGFHQKFRKAILEYLTGVCHVSNAPRETNVPCLTIDKQRNLGIVCSIRSFWSDLGPVASLPGQADPTRRRDQHEISPERTKISCHQLLFAWALEIGKNVQKFQAQIIALGSKSKLI
ncbi:hypothetical protein CPSG_02238 [Coccidioides posadasii str. Silveira]|uniref:Uncharacterized protein n=1 Tax=Coccidioides posadasii (strain RMSCC 757 / Silveira) TaxID=443226 RepID=E9CV82_COCPS|nr:hypothetical protein CPSG_02238 [Coccidioides posadasii str. Silveira]